MRRISRWMGLLGSLPITKTNCSSSSLHETPSAANFHGIAGWKGVRLLLREGEQQENHQQPARQDKRGKGKKKAARKWRGHILIKFSGTKRRSATCIEGLSRGDIISLMKTLPPSLLELHIGKDGPIFSVSSGLSPPARSIGGDSLDALAQEVREILHRLLHQ